MQICEPGARPFASDNQMPINGAGSSGSMYDVTDVDGSTTSMAYGDRFRLDHSPRGPNGDTVNYQSISHPPVKVGRFYGVDMW